MLSNVEKKITLTGKSVINGVNVEGFQATIDSTNPLNMQLTSWQENKELYKANRVECRADEAEFEDMAYEIQDAMIAESKSSADETE